MKKFSFIILFLSYSVNCSAQVLNLDSLFGKKQELILKVKQLDQFVKRFNNEENIFTGEEKRNAQLFKEKENKVDFQNERIKTIISLINFEDSTLFNNTTKDFINYVCEDSNHAELDYTDDNWYARVNCAVKYKGKEQNIRVTLKKEGDNKKGYRWVFVGVNAPFINIKPMNYDTTKFISPMNHELDFMGLFNVFNDYENIVEYAHKDFESDDLSIFFSLVKAKEINYIKVNSVQYHFLQIKNWIFTVDYFNRPQSNSGWLISSVTNKSDAEKTDYKINNLYLRL